MQSELTNSEKGKRYHFKSILKTEDSGVFQTIYYMKNKTSKQVFRDSHDNNYDIDSSYIKTTHILPWGNKAWYKKSEIHMHYKQKGSK